MNFYKYRNELNIEDSGSKIVATTHELTDFRAFAYYKKGSPKKDAIRQVITQYIEWKKKQGENK